MGTTDTTWALGLTVGFVCALLRPRQSCVPEDGKSFVSAPKPPQHAAHCWALRKSKWGNNTASGQREGPHSPKSPLAEPVASLMTDPRVWKSHLMILKIPSALPRWFPSSRLCLPACGRTTKDRITTGRQKNHGLLGLGSASTPSTPTSRSLNS